MKDEDKTEGHPSSDDINSSDPVLADYQAYGFRGVIPKPYRVTELSRIVHDVISRK